MKFPVSRQAENAPANKKTSIVGTPVQKQINHGPSFQVFDKRSQATHQEALQKMANEGAYARQLQRYQGMADRGSQGALVAQLRKLSDGNGHASSLLASPAGISTVQRAADVSVMRYEDQVIITADGTVSDFQGGDSAGDYGWNGVTSYLAQATVGDETIKSPGRFNNDYIVAQSGHVLAEQNGGKGSDPKNVFAQDGGVNNGPYRTYFENPMRKALDKADEEDEVNFQASLIGDDITMGKLKKESDKVFL